MANFKINEKVFLKSTNEEVQIKKTIKQYGRKLKYILDNGKEVSENELLTIKEAKLLQESLHKSTKKGKETIENLAEKMDEKESVSPVEKPDQANENQQVEKVSKKSKKD